VNANGIERDAALAREYGSCRHGLGPKLSGQGRVGPVLEQSGHCPQCHIPETQTGYIHMRIGNSLGIVITDVLAQLR